MITLIVINGREDAATNFGTDGFIRFSYHKQLCRPSLYPNRLTNSARCLEPEHRSSQPSMSAPASSFDPFRNSLHSQPSQHLPDASSRHHFRAFRSTQQRNPARLPSGFDLFINSILSTKDLGTCASSPRTSSRSAPSVHGTCCKSRLDPGATPTDESFSTDACH